MLLGCIETLNVYWVSSRGTAVGMGAGRVGETGHLPSLDFMYNLENLNVFFFLVQVNIFSR